MNILWVENHRSFVSAAKQFLAAHAVTVAPSLADARTALASHHFDAVLIDYDLDDGKGDELVRELLQLPGRPRIVATSAHDNGNRKLTDAGADAVCSKMKFSKIGAVVAAPGEPGG